MCPWGLEKRDRVLVLCENLPKETTDYVTGKSGQRGCLSQRLVQTMPSGDLFTKSDHSPSPNHRLMHEHDALKLLVLR